ncbi:polysaccharide lyase family 3 protein [Diplocarpon rosae]|nr:polysaccharide lyase family 3 protein [Diplocarpon rosae]
MKFTSTALTTTIATMAVATFLNIPARNGPIISLSLPMNITGHMDFDNKEYDRGQPCNSDADTGRRNAVFILADGASISNVIIGADQIEGIHCRGSCKLTNVWFRDVCEDAISVTGNGTVYITGGGAQNAHDKVIQHNGQGLVSLKDYTVVNIGRLFRSCGNCSKQYGPRSINIHRLRAYNVTAGLIGINSNYGDMAVVNKACGSHIKNVCQEFKGVLKSEGIPSTFVNSTTHCRGKQGKLTVLPTCDEY